MEIEKSSYTVGNRGFANPKVNFHSLDPDPPARGADVTIYGITKSFDEQVQRKLEWRSTRSGRPAPDTRHCRRRALRTLRSCCCQCSSAISPKRAWAAAGGSRSQAIRSPVGSARGARPRCRGHPGRACKPRRTFRSAGAASAGVGASPRVSAARHKDPWIGHGRRSQVLRPPQGGRQACGQSGAATQEQPESIASVPLSRRRPSGSWPPGCWSGRCRGRWRPGRRGRPLGPA